MGVVEGSTRKESSADALELNVRDADVASVHESTGSVGVFLGLHDLVEDGVDVGGWDVSGVTAVVAEGADEGGVVVLLADGWVGARGDEAWAQELGLDGAVVVWREADLVGKDGAGGWPVLQGPLAVERAGGPGDGVDLNFTLVNREEKETRKGPSAYLLASRDGRDVVDSIRGVLGSNLDIRQVLARDIHVHRVSNTLRLQQLSIVWTKVATRQRTSSRKEQNWRQLPSVPEVRRNVDDLTQLRLREIVRRIARVLLGVNRRGRGDGVKVVLVVLDQVRLGNGHVIASGQAVEQDIHSGLEDIMRAGGVDGLQLLLDLWDAAGTRGGDDLGEDCFADGDGGGEGGEVCAEARGGVVQLGLVGDFGVSLREGWGGSDGFAGFVLDWSWGC